MVVSYSGIAGRRGKNPTRIVLHNDGGSRNATAAFYKAWLENHNPELGFAHEYIASDGSYQAEKEENSAWHCANAVGNRDYYGIEVCQSLGDEKTFLANEQKAFKRAAELCKKWNFKPEYSIFPLHKDLSSTDCPHRAVALHGKSNKAVRDYYVAQVKKYMGGNSVNQYWNQTGWYEMLVDDTFYVDKKFKKASGWKPKKGSRIHVDKVVMDGKVPRGQVRLGNADRFITLNKKYVKKV